MRGSNATDEIGGCLLFLGLAAIMVRLAKLGWDHPDETVWVGGLALLLFGLRWVWPVLRRTREIMREEESEMAKRKEDLMRIMAEQVPRTPVPTSALFLFIGWLILLGVILGVVIGITAGQWKVFICALVAAAAWLLRYSAKVG